MIKEIGILIISIQYSGNLKLNGTLNDSFLFKKMIENHYSKNPNIKLKFCILTDRQNRMKKLIGQNSKYSIEYKDANKDTILNSLQRILHKFNNIYIYYTGHGYQVLERNNDDKDGKDEVIIPSNHTTGLILDDEIFNLVQKYMKKNKRVRMIMDCCNSGTLVDLPFRNNIFNYRNNKLSINGDIIAISGCRDEQYSYERLINSKYHGILTYCLNYLDFYQQFLAL